MREFYTRDEILHLCKVHCHNKHEKSDYVEERIKASIPIWLPETKVLVVPHMIIFLDKEPLGIKLPSRFVILSKCVIKPSKVNSLSAEVIDSVIFGCKQTNTYGAVVPSLSIFRTLVDSDEFHDTEKAIVRANEYLKEPYKSKLMAFSLSNFTELQNRWVILIDGIFTGDYKTKKEAELMSNARMIRKRQSYNFWKEVLNFLNTNPNKFEILRKIDSLIDEKHGYGSATNAGCSEESLDLVIKEAQDKR